MKNWILSRPGILGGKPYVSGTTLTVEFIEQQLADGVTGDELLAAHPQLTRDGLDAARRHVVQVTDRGIVRPGRYDHRRPRRGDEPSPVATQIFKRDY